MENYCVNLFHDAHSGRTQRDSKPCRKYLGAGDYPQAALTVISEMHRQGGELCVDEKGLALKGLLVRHLVIPNLLDDTREIMRWLATELSRDTTSMSWTNFVPRGK